MYLLPQKEFCPTVYKTFTVKVLFIGTYIIYLQRETVVAWSRSTGKPFHNAILWHDSRTSDMVSRFKKKVGRERVEYMTGLPMSTYFSATKILWLMENVPSVLQAIKEEGQ